MHADIGVRTISLTGTDRLGNLAVAPSKRAALLTVVTPPPVSTTQTIVPSWVTSTGYVEEINGRPKVGDAPSGGTRIGFMTLAAGDVKWLTVSPAGRAATANVLGWNDDGTAALIFSTSTDFKDRWIHTVTGDSGTLKLVDTLHDSAWVGGPCFGAPAGSTAGAASTSSPKPTATRTSTRSRRRRRQAAAHEGQVGSERASRSRETARASI